MEATLTSSGTDLQLQLNCREIILNNPLNTGWREAVWARTDRRNYWRIGIFLQTRYTNDQQTSEKMLNISHRQKNTNQITMKYHFTPIRIAIVKKTCVVEDVEKLKFLYTVGGNAKWWKLFQKTLWWFPQNFKNNYFNSSKYRIQDPTISPLGYSKEFKSDYLEDVNTPKFIAALFTIAKMWKWPKFPSKDKEYRKCSIFQWNTILP